MEAAPLYKALLLYILALPVCTVGAFALPGADTTAVQVSLLPDSRVSITGYTNVNTFTCLYCGEVPPLPSTIQAVVSTGGWILDPRQARLALEVAYFDCGIRQMNEDFRSLLQAEEHPALLIRLQSLDHLEKDQYTATALLRVAGETRRVCLPLTVTPGQDGTVTATGELSIKLTDFGLDPPTRLMGMVKVKDRIEVMFDLKLRLSQPR